MESNQKAYDAALAVYRQAEEWHTDFVLAQAAGNTVIAAEHRNLLAELSPLALWEHWKSQNEPGMTDVEDHWKFYVGKGLELKDGVLKVPYVALYAPHAGKLFDRVLVDPEEGFSMPINRPQWTPKPYVGLRFRLVRTLTLRQCDKLIADAAHIARNKTRSLALTAIERALDLPVGRMIK